MSSVSLSTELNIPVTIPGSPLWFFSSTELFNDIFGLSANDLVLCCALHSADHRSEEARHSSLVRICDPE